MPDLAVRLAEIKQELIHLKKQADAERLPGAAELEAELDTTLCRLLAAYGHDLIAVLDDESKVRWVTPNCTSMFGWAPEQIIGRPMNAFVHEEDVSHVPWGSGWIIESPVTYRFRLANGLYHWVETRSIPEVATQVIATRDINAHYMAQSKASDIGELFADELERMAHTDALTLLPNRRSVERTLEREISRSTRSGTSFSVVFFDIDRFKAINDTYGHIRGDYVLKEVGQRLANALRPYDFIGRWGGDEFLLVLPETDRDHAVSAARRLSATLASKHVPPVGAVTVSGGVAEHSGEALETLIDRADRALYRAKGGGRNRIELDGP